MYFTSLNIIQEHRAVTIHRQWRILCKAWNISIDKSDCDTSVPFFLCTFSSYLYVFTHMGRSERDRTVTVTVTITITIVTVTLTRFPFLSVLSGHFAPCRPITRHATLVTKMLSTVVFFLSLYSNIIHACHQNIP